MNMGMLLEISGLTSHYGRIQALKGIDVQIAEGELVALVGANGAGKTTLLRCMSGVQPVTGGTIKFDGQDITKMAPEQRVGLGISQSPEGRQVFGPMSVEDNLLLGAYRRRGPSVKADMDRMYEMFPILHKKRELPAGTLSGGQQQMLAIARSLMANPRVLLLDEPSMGLAPLLVAEIFRTIQALKDQGTTIFLVEQNAYAALAIADRGYVLETGAVVLTDEGSRLLNDDKVKEAYLGL
jgi:branched-chain amino acid transport system ATP-binding protein